MTTPAQDAPLVLPHVAFRPVRLLIISVVLTATAVVVGGLLGNAWFGLFFGIGLGLGLVNAVLVKRSVESITADAHPLKRAMALNSAARLAVITIVGLVIAIIFKPTGLGVLFGLAMFQALLVISTAVPVMRSLRGGGSDEPNADVTQASKGEAS